MASITKLCSVCGSEKLRSEFSQRRRSSDGLRPCCKSCQRGYYESNKDKYLQRNRRRKELIRQLIIRTKSKPCSDCGKVYPYWIMQFDHLSDKSFSIGKHAHTKGIKQVEREMAKCDVVCANCHADRTYKRHRERKNKGP